MTRLSVKWSVNIALMLTVSMLVPEANADQAATAGTDAANQALGVYGSNEGIRDNAYTPLTSNATQMKSIDGTKSFTGQIQCPSSKEFLTVLLTPQTGGDVSAIVGEDLNFDGKMEYSYSVPFPVSGVCANGVISCNPGTWNNCMGYKWTANSAAQATLTNASISDLGGCYCINDSCGTNLFMTQTSQILSTVGGGVAGAIQGISPKYTVSETNISGTSISYHGQNTGGCSSVAASQNLPTNYYTSGSLLAGDGTTEAQTQAADPTSYYSLLNTAYANSATSSKYASCSVNRVGSVASSIKNLTQAPVAGRLCADHYINMRIHRVDNLNYQLEYLDTSPGGSPHSNCGGAFPWEAPIGSDSWHDVATVSFTPQNGTNYQLTAAIFSMQNIQGPGCTSGSASVNGLLNGFDTTVNSGVVCPAGSAQYPTYNWSYDFQWTQDTYTESISDDCAALEQDQNCFLQSERVDGVMTWNNYMSTGISPLPSCQTFSGAVSNFTECRNWWSKKRVYKCTSNTTWDFADAKKRADNVVSTTTDNTTSMAYQDLKKDASGNWTSENDSVTLGTRTDYSAPILACKTRKPSRKTDAVLSGNATQYLSDPSSWDFYYKRCDSSGVCPVDAASGEQVVINCQKINEFAEAATIMNVLENANKDMTCSNGNVDANSGQCLGQIYFFSGASGSCKEPGTDTSFFQCCTTDSGSFLMVEAACGSSDRQTSEAMFAKRTHFVGTHCVDSWPMVGCVQKAQVHCVFQSKLGRIIQEQGRPQLSTAIHSWGTADAPNCRGFTPEEFQSLDFSKMDLSEFFTDIKTKTDAAIQQGMKTNVQNYYNNTGH